MKTRFKIGDIVMIDNVWLNKDMLKDEETNKDFKEHIGKIGKITNIVRKGDTKSEMNRYIYMIENIENSSWNWREIRKPTEQEIENWVKKQVIEKL